MEDDGGGAALADLVAAIRACRLCRDAPRAGPPLPQEPRPILRIDPAARLLVASQAPGIRAHTSGLPFDDPSGERLRAWMGIDRAAFYEPRNVLIAPMGFCFPGHTADKGDLPPRRECRQLWHDRLFAALPRVALILAIGRYAQDYHFDRLGRNDLRKLSLEQRVRLGPLQVEDGPALLALPHPSWRNSGWLKRNPWFEAEILPQVRARVAAILHPLPFL